MHHQVRLARKLLAQPDGRPEDARSGEVPVGRYTEQGVFEREARLLARVPRPLLCSTDLPSTGACVPVEIGGVRVLVVRSEDGVRAFRNACRHRSTELVHEPCTKKAIVCPYHGWTYDLRGRRIHVPHADAFPKDARDALVSVHAEERHGFIWLALEPFDLRAYLGSIDDDLASLSSLSVFRRKERHVRGNWKLVIDAFLDGYHIRQLHRDTIYRFFADARFEAERVGPHIRAITARRALFEAKSIDEASLRQLVTPSHLIFPSTITIFHPDYASVLVMEPLAPDETRFTHVMLVPPGGEEAHWNKSFTLIDEGVFAREDLAIVEAMQRGMQTGANDNVLFGELEHGSLWFHETLRSQMEK